jgi:hypothetical protein
LNKILNNYSNSVALDGNPEPEPDLVHATGYKQPSLKKEVDAAQNSEKFSLRNCYTKAYFLVIPQT